jgi:hypothetical protein
MTAFFREAGTADIRVQNRFRGPSTKGWSFRFQSLTVMTREALGLASEATGGRRRRETPIHPA